MPRPLDFALVALFAAIWPLYSHFVSWPAHLRAVARGDRNARTRAYAWTILEQWLLAAAALALCAHFARPLTALGLRAPAGWRLWLGAALPLAYAALLVLQTPGLVRSPKRRARLRERVADLRALLPHTRREFGLFIPLSITAGIVEEFLFRGYLVWALQPWLTTLGAAAASMVVFGLAHSYQGVKFGIRAFAAGVGMGLFALVTGSVIPGMVMHALIDIGSGLVTYIALSEGEGGAARAAGAEAMAG